MGVETQKKMMNIEPFDCAQGGPFDCAQGGHRTPNGREQVRHCRDALNPTTQQPTTSNTRQLQLTEFACGNPVATSTVLVKKEALAAVGGFDEQFRGPEDYDLWMRLAARFPVALIETPLARYRQLRGSLSMDDRKFLPQVLRVLDKAYGAEGVLHGTGSKRRAAGYQYLACAWMAAERGDLGRAWTLLFKSVLAWPGSYRSGAVQLRWPRLKLFVRFASLTLRAGKLRMKMMNHGERN